MPVAERMPFDSRWLVTCSCGWGRECVSAWQARAAAKLHHRLGELDVKHAVSIEAPEPPGGSQGTAVLDDGGGLVGNRVHATTPGIRPQGRGRPTSTPLRVFLV